MVWDASRQESWAGRRRLVLPALVAVGILIASVMPVPGGGGAPGFLFIPADKLAHFSIYGLLAASLGWAWPDWGQDPWVIGLLLFGLVVLYGVGIEVIQAFLPTRTFSVLDSVANGLGAAIGLPVGRWVGRAGIQGDS